MLTSKETELQSLIAEQQKRIAALEESERLFRATFEQTSVGKAHVSFDGKWLRVNDRLCEITGYSRQELLATTFQAITHPDDLHEDVERANAVAIGAIQRYSIEKRYLRKDGSIVWVYLTVSALRDDSGRPQQFISVVEDISARKAAEESLRKSEDRFRALYEDAPLGIAIADPAGHLLQCNRAYASMLGYTQAELKGRPFLDFIHPEDREANAAEIERLKSGEVDRIQIENRYVAADGATVWVSKYVTLLRDADGNPEQLVARVVDVSTRRSIEEQLKLERERFNFATEAAEIGYWFADLPFDKLIWDRRVKEHFWLSPDADADIDLFYARLHPDDRERNRQAVERSIAERSRYDIEYRTVDPHSGQVKWIRSLGRAAYDPQNMPIRFHGITLDVTDQVKAREALASSEERLRLFIENAPVGIAMFDTQMRYIAASKQWKHDYGIHGDIIGRDHYEVLPGVPERWIEAHRRGLAGEVISVDRDYFERVHGRALWIKWQINPWYTPAGQIGGIMIAAEDITASVQAEERLRESERQITDFANSIPTLAWMANGDGWIFWYNQRWYEYTGTGPAQMEGWGWQSVHDPAVLPQVMEKWTASIRAGEPFEMLFPLRGADGSFRTFLTRIVPLKNSAGKVVRWFGTNTDVDELRRTREQLALTEERMRVSLKILPVRLYTLDRNLRCTWFYSGISEADARAFIGTAAELSAYEPPYLAGPAQELLRDVLESGIGSRREIRTIANGSERVLDVWAEPLRDSEGQLSGVTVAAMDITDRVLSEETLRKQEKLALVGRMSATIAHEINNPLAAVFNLLFLCQTAPTLEAASGFVRLAEEELKRVSEIVKNTLIFNRESVSSAPESVSEILKSAMTIFEGRIKKAGVRVSATYRDSQPVLGRGSELRQVFANLIGNALDASRPGDKLILRSKDRKHPRSGEPGVLVTVADTGRGMNNETLRHIAEPFFTTKGLHGTGLGLWVSKDVVEKHRGDVRVRSREGRGTVFTVWLPVTRPHEPA